MHSEDPFREIWQKLANEGACDDADGADYHRVRSEWLVTGPAHEYISASGMEGFIRNRANAVPWGRLGIEQKKLMNDLEGLKDQIEKGHFLNVHFRAFQLGYAAWQEHIRLNAMEGSRSLGSPGGAVLDPRRDNR